MEKLTITEMWDVLVTLFNVSSDTLNIITSINGYNEDTMCDILYVVSGYRDFDDVKGDI